MRRLLSRVFLAACLAAPLAVGLAPGLQAETLQQTFTALPVKARMALQRELARADLYLAETNGDWSAATERALLRSAEDIAMKTGDRIHPKLTNAQDAQRYMTRLAEGNYSRLLYGGNFLERIFFLDSDLIRDMES